MNKEGLKGSESNGESAVSLVERSTNLAAGHGGLKPEDFLDVCKKTIPDFKYIKLIMGEYPEAEVDQIETAIEAWKTEHSMLPPSEEKDTEEKKEEEPVKKEETSTKPHTVTAAVGKSESGPVQDDDDKALKAIRDAEAAKGREEDEKRKARNKKIAATALAITAAATIGGVTGGAIVHHMDAQDATPTEATQEDKADQTVEDEETAESAEGLQIREDYRGGYEDEDGNHVHGYADETGKHANPNKIGRTGEAAPYNFDEAFTYESHDQFADYMEEDACRQKVLFLARYSMLDDSVKPEIARGLDDAELVELANSNPEAYQEIVDSYSALLRAETSSSEATTITGDVTNKFVDPTVEDGVMLGDRNLEIKHCVTHEEGSDVVAFTYALPGGGTDTVYYRMACGLQPIAETGTPQSDRIIEQTPEMPTPTPEKTPEPTPEPEPGGGDEELQEKTPFTEDQVFNRGDEAGNSKDTSEDAQAIREDTKTSEPEVQQSNPVERERQEAAPVSQPAREASQETSSHKADPAPAETQARQTQDQADTRSEAANQASQQKSSAENKADRDKVAEDFADGTAPVGDDADF